VIFSLSSSRGKSKRDWEFHKRYNIKAYDAGGERRKFVASGLGSNYIILRLFSL